MNRKIYFIIPPAFSHRTAEENLGVGYLTAVLRKKGYQVCIIDAWICGTSMEELLKKISRIIDEEKDNILYFSISTYVSCLTMVKNIVEKIKRKSDIPIVAGGFGPSFFPGEFLDIGVDIVSYGEGEKTHERLCNYFMGNERLEDINGIIYWNEDKLIKTKPNVMIGELDNLPFPARDNLDIIIQRKSSVNILSARGCKGACKFCSVIAFHKLSKGKLWRQRSIKNFVDEIESLYKQGVDFFKVIDDSFVEKPRNAEWCRELRDEIKKRNIDARFRGSLVAEQVTDEIIGYLKDMGFFSFACGIESFSNTALLRFGKRATVKDNINALNVFHKHNIFIQCGFILFDPYTTMEELEENLSYFKIFDFILCKGIFTELYAAEGTEFTNKLLLDSDTGLLKRNNENYKYVIRDRKVLAIYDALKKWHRFYGNTYDMLIDPLTAPKNISTKYMYQIYNCYLAVRKRDVEFMEKVIVNVKVDCNIDFLVDSEIKKNRQALEKTQLNLKRIYVDAKLDYDGDINTYL